MEDNYEEINIDKIHKIHNEMLKEVAAFLDKNNIKYFIEYGTLLGAVRHKGFIPWDDDVDLSMPRPEYEKFMEIVRKNDCKITDKLIVTSIELNNSIFPFCKIYNKEYCVKEDMINIKEGEFLWIDVFPFDALSDSDKDNQELFIKIMFWHKIWIIRVGTFKQIYNTSTTLIKGVIKVLFKAVLNLFSAKSIARKMRKLANKYDYNQCDAVQNIIWTPKLYKKILKQNLNETTTLQFEDNTYTVMKSYDNYLRTLYGDYMELPPEEKRITHLVKIWKNEEV